MIDTQWPRYQVFVQEQPGGAYLDAGSVHAADGEMALLNARDVFARRPGVASVWVVPADAITSRTRQELEEARGGNEPSSAAQEIAPNVPASEASGEEPFYVFCKLKAAGTQTLVGTVDAGSATAALRRAIEVYDQRSSAGMQPFAWWVFPAWLVIQNEAQDAGSLFEPALDKPFRLSTDFRTETLMRTIKRSGS